MPAEHAEHEVRDFAYLRIHAVQKGRYREDGTVMVLLLLGARSLQNSSLSLIGEGGDQVSTPKRTTPGLCQPGL